MYAVLDTETTGLTPDHEVIEVAVILVDEATLELRHSYAARIRPERLEIAEPRALEVNGYNAVDWQHALPASVALGEVIALLEGTVPVGHNVGYDTMMLTANMARCGIPTRVPHSKVDTVTLVREHLFPLGLTHTGLDSVRKFLGWPTHHVHTASVDAQDTYQLFRLLWRMNWFRRSRIAWSRKLGVPIACSE
jgi:DNA polymerase-3 subunit epsilon